MKAKKPDRAIPFGRRFVADFGSGLIGTRLAATDLFSVRRRNSGHFWNRISPSEAVAQADGGDGVVNFNCTPPRAASSIPFGLGLLSLPPSSTALIRGSENASRRR